MALDFSRVYTLGFPLGGAEAAPEGKSVVLQLVVGFRDVFWVGEMDYFSTNPVSLGWDYSEARLERGTETAPEGESVIIHSVVGFRGEFWPGEMKYFNKI
jgi:hypothetical protein